MRPLLKPYGTFGGLIPGGLVLSMTAGHAVKHENLTYPLYWFLSVGSAVLPTYTNKLSEHVSEALFTTVPWNQFMKSVLLLIASVSAEAG
jgi:hypothetical protein